MKKDGGDKTAHETQENWGWAYKKGLWKPRFCKGEGKENVLNKSEVLMISINTLHVKFQKYIF